MNIHQENLIFLQGVLHGFSLLSNNRTMSAIELNSSLNKVVKELVAFYEIDENNIIEESAISFFSIEYKLKIYLQEIMPSKQIHEYEYLAYKIMDYLQFCFDFEELKFSSLLVQQISIKQPTANFISKHFLIGDGVSEEYIVINLF